MDGTPPIKTITATINKSVILPIEKVLLVIKLLKVDNKLLFLLFLQTEGDLNSVLAVFGIFLTNY